MPNFLINTDIKLQNIIKDLKSSSVIGLDTEFIRESTYYPILALLQLSDENHTYCIDILALEDKEPIINLLKDKNIIKIIHSSKQDLEVLNNYYDCYPENIFDTQLADNFLNPQISISYSNLVKKHFNVFLKEGSWRTDWLKRPISNDKLEYAGNDVKYLIKLHEILKSELTKLERYDWFLEEQDLELKKSNVVTEPAMAWEKVNLPSKITETQINHLKILSKWREEKAIQNDMPKRWIFSDSELIKITLARSNKIMSILDVTGVSKSFGGVKANVDISMSVEQGSIVGLIGPNGSGKTTLFNSIVGTYPIDKGSIKFDGTEVSELPVPVVAKLGLLRTFQQTRIYGKLNCIENMLISHKPENDGILTVFQKIPSDLTDKAETLLKFVGLHQKRKLRAGDLSFGQQKLLELAMALMNEPKMLLLDEPTAGINPTLINGIIDRLIKVNKEYGITLLVIEHNMKVIMNLAQKVFCLAHGQMLANGTPEEIKNDKRVLDAYLGAQ